MDTLNRKTEGAEGSAPRSLQPSHAMPVTRESGQTAAHAVLFTPELLCNIISQLPLADIVTTTGVCHFWRSAVAVDPTLQEALFFSPEEVRRVLVHKTMPGVDFEQVFSQHNPGDAIPDEFCYTIGDMHPFLHKICGLANGIFSKFENEESAPDFGHSDGSWRDMFISKPPCKIIEFTLTACRTGASHDVIFRYTKNNGVRLGGLQNSILFVLRKGEELTGHTMETGGVSC